MDIDNFFSGKPIKRKVVSSGTTQQNIQARDNNGNSRHQQDGRRIQNRYAAQFVNDFKNEIWRVSGVRGIFDWCALRTNFLLI